jgi:hypothetical protein
MPTKRQLDDPYAALPNTSRTQRDDPYADLPDSTASPHFTTNLKGEGLYRMGTYDYSGGRVSKPEILIPFSRISDAVASGYKLHPDEIRRYAKDVSYKGRRPSLLERAGNLVERMTEPVADRPLEWNTGQRTVGSFIRSAPAALSNVGALPINVATRTYRGLAGLPGQTIQTVKGIRRGDPEALESLNPITMAENERRGYQADVDALGPVAALGNLGGDVAATYVAMEAPKRLPMSLSEIKKIVRERIAPTVKYAPQKINVAGVDIPVGKGEAEPTSKVEGEPTYVDTIKKDAGTEDSTRDPREVQRANAQRTAAQRALSQPKSHGGVPSGTPYVYRRRIQEGSGSLRVLGDKDADTGGEHGTEGRTLQREALSGTAGGGEEPHREGAVPEGSPRLDAGEVRRDGGVLRVLGARVYETWSLDPTKSAELATQGIKSPDIHELDFRDPQSAEAFHASISALKTNNPFAASVHVYDKAEYATMRMFLTADGKAGFALKSDGDIVSVFAKGADAKGASRSMLEIAKQAGGVKLDCFDTILPKHYSRHGFKAVARVPWNDEYAPEGWDKATFAEFNNGKPDVVFMVYALAGAELYKPGDGKTVSDYNEAVRLQNEAVDDLLGELRSLYDDWKRANGLTASVFQKAAMTTPTPRQAAVNRLLKGTANAVATAPRQHMLSSRERLEQLKAEAARRRPAPVQ